MKRSALRGIGGDTPPEVSGQALNPLLIEGTLSGAVRAYPDRTAEGTQGCVPYKSERQRPGGVRDWRRHTPESPLDRGDFIRNDGR